MFIIIVLLLMFSVPSPTNASIDYQDKQKADPNLQDCLESSDDILEQLKCYINGEQNMSVLNVHSEMVTSLKKDPQQIIDELTPEKADAWHMASCVPGEAGELFDAVKKYAVYDKPIDRNNVVEELGDLEFYMEGLRQTFNIDREETLAHNIAKLSKRYASLQYSNSAAQARVDKV